MSDREEVEPETCPSCWGSGWDDAADEACFLCDGTGVSQ